MSDRTVSSKCDAILADARTIALHLLWQCKAVDKADGVA